MHIVFDARAFSWTGVGRYIRHILQEFTAIGHRHTFTVLVGRNEIEEFNTIIKLPQPMFRIASVEPSYFTWREQILFWQQIRQLKADLFHFPNFNVPLLFNRPYVVTIHDITRFIFPGQRRQSLRQQIGYELVFTHAVQKAQAIMCVSEATKNELATLPIRLPHHREVIHEGVSQEFFQSVDVKQRQKVRMLLGIQNPYLLYVGVWMNHKNIHRLLEAFKLVKQDHPELKLVITGKPIPGYINVIRSVRLLDLERDVLFPGFVPHDVLPALYAEATCFVFPSLYEGFGLPALEAAACGTPVVTSNVSSLPEVMNDAALFINPEHVAAIARGIRRVLEDKNTRQMLISRGRERAAEFSWRSCAEKTLALYEKRAT